MDIKKSAKQLGKRGGNKTKEKYGKKRYSQMGIIGAGKRWKIDVKVDINGNLYKVWKIDFASGDKKSQSIVYFDKNGDLKEITGDYPIKLIKEKI